MFAEPKRGKTGVWYASAGLREFERTLATWREAPASGELSASAQSLAVGAGLGVDVMLLLAVAVGETRLSLVAVARLSSRWV